MQNNSICHENSIVNTPSETISPYCVFVTPWIDYLFFAYFFYFCKPCHALLNSLGGMYVDKLDPGKLQIYYVYRSYAFEKCNLYCLYRVKEREAIKKWFSAQLIYCSEHLSKVLLVRLLLNYNFHWRIRKSFARGLKISFFSTWIFFFKTGILLSKFFWPTVRKKMS